MTVDLSEYEGDVVLLGGSGLRKNPHRPSLGRNKTDVPLQNVRIERARYAKVEDAFRGYLQRLMRGYIGGKVDRETLLREFSTNLHKFQSVAYNQGRRTAGDVSDKLTDADMKYLHGQHSLEMRYFHKFVRQIDAGKGRMPYKIRMDLYGLSGWTLYVRGFVRSLDGGRGMRFHWIRNILAESCPDCVKREAISKEIGGFTVAQLEGRIGYPGQYTRCGSRCQCRLEPAMLGFPLRRTRPVTFKHAEKLDGKRTHKPAKIEESPQSAREAQ